MKKSERKYLQDKRDEKIRQGCKGFYGITKTDSLLRRAKKLGIATDAPATNREKRRRDLAEAVREVLKK